MCRPFLVGHDEQQVEQVYLDRVYSVRSVEVANEFVVDFEVAHLVRSIEVVADFEVVHSVVERCALNEDDEYSLQEL